MERALRAAEFDVAVPPVGRGAVGVELGKADQRSARVSPQDFERVGNLPVVGHGEVASHGSYRCRRIVSQRPLDDVEVMRAEIGELAA